VRRIRIRRKGDGRRTAVFNFPFLIFVCSVLFLSAWYLLVGVVGGGRMGSVG